jgi:hypothetical protein
MFLAKKTALMEKYFRFSKHCNSVNCNAQVKIIEKVLAI